MPRRCSICGQVLMDGDDVHVGVRTTYKVLPNGSTWDIGKPEHFIFVNHWKCEDL